MPYRSVRKREHFTNCTPRKRLSLVRPIIVPIRPRRKPIILPVRQRGILLIELLIEQMQKNEKLQQRLVTLQTLSLNVLPLELFIDPSLK